MPVLAGSERHRTVSEAQAPFHGLTEREGRTYRYRGFRGQLDLRSMSNP
jgi:hypothetical protein